MDSTDFTITDYDYSLPVELIAQIPSAVRDASRLLVVDRTNQLLDIAHFSELGRYLPRNSLILANNSTVVPGRFRGQSHHGAETEMLILTPLDLLKKGCVNEGGRSSVSAHVLLRPSKKFKSGTRLQFGELRIEILEKKAYGRCLVQMRWQSKTLEDILLHSGEVPLPPYIKRNPDVGDSERYQTVYANRAEKGSIAAPTAGLHFTREMKSALLEAGHSWEEVTLFVGYGTFNPIRCEDVREHRMHPEYVKIRPETAERIRRALRDKQPIVAVGTTTMRTVEGVAQHLGKVEAYEGWLDTYIYPGFEFKVVQGLITNFHLPRSSLLILVSAFAGRERILAAYRRAVEERFRFFSYGDCMFIRP